MSIFTGVSSGVGSISTALEFLGQIFASILTNEYASYSIVLLCIAAITATIFEATLSKIPIFQNSNKLVKIVAWSMSIMGVVGIHWMFKDQGISRITIAFAGPMGIFIIVGLVVFVWFSIYKNMSESRPAARRAWSSFVAGFVFFWLLGAIRGGDNYLGSFITINLIAFGIALITYFAGGRD